MHCSLAEGNFCDEYGNAVKPAVVQDYNRCMGYTDRSDCMTDSYSISRSTWKCRKKLFFHLLDLSVLNSFILLASCGSRLSHQNFRHALVRDLIQEANNTANPLGLTYDTLNIGPQKENEYSAACVLQKRKK
jgi:hypothetical protein